MTACLRSLVISFVHSTPGSITATSCLSDFLPISAPTTSADRTQRRSSFAISTSSLYDLAILHWLRLPERVNFKLALDHGIPNVERYGATISESTRSGIKPARSSLSAVVVHAAAAHSTVPSVNSRPLLVSCCSLHFLQHFARRCAVCTVCLFLLATCS